MYEAREIDFDEPIYVMTVIDENGNQQLSGILFPAIRKSDGMIAHYVFPLSCITHSCNETTNPFRDGGFSIPKIWRLISCWMWLHLHIRTATEVLEWPEKI